MSDKDKCPFCGEPCLSISNTGGMSFLCGTYGPDVDGDYDPGHTCDITTYNRLLKAADAEIERLTRERDEREGAANWLWEWFGSGSEEVMKRWPWLKEE